MGLIVRLPDGSQREVPEGTTPAEVAASLGPHLAREAVAAKLDGEWYDLTRPLERGGDLRFLTWESEEGREVVRHSTAHLMAQAVKRLFPGARLAVGPAIEDGFYYDVEVDRPLTPEDLERIEEEMERIMKEDQPIERQVLSREEAIRLFSDRDEEFKVELIQELPEDEVITAYRQGEFVDLCTGPHLPRTGWKRAFKLMSVAGAYWRGDEGGRRLQRIYGTVWSQRKELEAYLHRLEEARRRDHRRLGPELELFGFHPEAPGLAFWYPKGMVIYNELREFSREIQRRAGYQEVFTPSLLDASLWKRSGHWDHYRENMYLVEKEGEPFALKPMNCPGHMLIFKSRTRSYRDLPLRLAEYGHVHRYERSGVLHGLLRVRGFVQDDAHLFVREEQIEGEIAAVLRLIDQFYAPFGMPYAIRFSTRPDDYMGELSLWEKAEASLARAIEGVGLPYELNPKDGAFYGPKLDIEVTDSLGRRWQCATIQLDFQNPEKFDLHYMDEEGRQRRPVMIHRALMGSLERFVGILTEHYGGAFPTWLAPVQVKLLPVAERHLPYAGEVARVLSEAGLRSEVDGRDEKVGYKVRQAQLEKVPYMLVLGDREVESRQVSVRSRAKGEIGTEPLDAFVERVRREVATREGGRSDGD